MDLSPSAQLWLNVLLLWLGFGIVVGMIAQVILPEGEPKGVFGVLVIGVAGSCAGSFLLSQFWKPEEFNPISPAGLFLSVLASLLFFLLYRSALAFVKRASEHASEHDA